MKVTKENNRNYAYSTSGNNNNSINNSRNNYYGNYG